MKKAGLLFAALTFVAQMASASSIFQFATFNDASNVFQFINNGASGIFQTIAGPGGTEPVTFSYTGLAGLPVSLQGGLSALMKVDLPTSQGATSTFVPPSVYYTTQGFNQIGTIAFDLVTPITSGVPGCTVASPCSNLLTVSVTQLGAGLNGARGGGSFNLSGDVPNFGDSFTYSSDFLTFGTQGNDQLQGSFGSANPCFTRAVNGSCTTGALTVANTGTLVHTVTASGGINFSTSNVIVNAVPEPVTMMLTGSALIGLALIMRKKNRA